MLHWLKAAESHTKPFGEKQGAFVIVAIDLPIKYFSYSDRVMLNSL